MDATDQAAEQIVRMTLAGSEMALRLTGAGAKNLAAALMAAAASSEKTKGKTRLAAMLKSGKELKVFSVPADELKNFAAEAKRYGVIYVVVKEKDRPDTVDLMVRAEDASKINRIIERLGLGTVEDDKKAPSSSVSVDNTPEKSVPSGKIEAQDVQAAEDLLGELLDVSPSRTQTGDADPLVQAPNATQSEPTSGIKQPSEKASEKQAQPGRESVRSKIRAIEKERTAKPRPENPSTPSDRFAHTPKPKQIKTPKER